MTWYITAEFRNDTYYIAAALNSNQAVLIKNLYSNQFRDVRFEARLCKLSKLDRESMHTQHQFILDYKRSHYVVAHIDHPDLSVRYD